MSENIDYKETIKLPQTDFSMKAGLAKKEPLMVEKWLSENIYSQMYSSESTEIFCMPDGPPYANGGIHMGHTLNKCLKDFTIKYKNLQGFKAAYYPGWDCHGLPIEHKVLKSLKNKSEATPKIIRQKCREEAMKWVTHQKEQFQRLGIIADWDNPYLTLHKDYEAEEVRELARVLENGLLYRGQKPVYWCSALQTALAEAEVEYAPHKSPAVYVKFPMKLNESLNPSHKKTSIVIWTTTPWTLPSNTGIALHKDYEYQVFEVNDEQIIIAKDLKEAFEKDTELELKPTTTIFKGSELEGQSAQHPFYERASKIILGSHVTLEAGTGCVHTAPGHGQDDYIVGIQYGLEVISPVDDRGCYTNEVPEYEGEHVFKANPLIVERLKENDMLLGHRIIKHSYPHCWRSKTPLIFRATSQWFIKMDLDNYNLRKKALGAIEETEFIPSWGVKRLTAMIEGRPDWCVSRQRNWGVPIPVFYCKSCEKEKMTPELLYKIADMMEEKEGIETYFESSNSELLGDDAQCGACGHTEFTKGTDILDVWFDSGICHAAVQARREGLTRPADLYLEGSDQHRGWFQTSLISSLASHGEAPFKKLLTHNFVNDDKGRKMSKSLGNYVDPMKLIQQSGAELLRLWTASQDYGQDMNFSQEGFKRVSETYRRLRNTFRFLLGNISDYDHNKDAVAISDMHPLDKWALHELNEFVKKSTEAYDKFEFYKVYHLLNNFFNVTLSAHYLDILKDRLYTWKEDGLERRSAQTVLYKMIETLSVIMAPITSFLSEEVHQSFQNSQETSVFTKAFPQAQAEWESPAIKAEFETLFEVRAKVNAVLEELRANKTIGRSLEAHIELSLEGKEYQCLKKYESLLCEIFIVSSCQLNEGPNSISAKLADGDKCERCWYISSDISKEKPYVGVCPKCKAALQ